MMTPRRWLWAIAPLLVLGINPGAIANDDDASASDPRFLEALRKAVNVPNIRRHQRAFQRFADRHGGTRQSGTRGYDRSAAYVARKLRWAGYKVRVQEFDFVRFQQDGPSTLEQLAPEQITYEEDTDYTLLTQTDAGDVAGLLSSVDLDLGTGNSSTSGCEPEDFAGFPAGYIALIQRGACSFQLKAENAAAAGAIGAIIFNQGNSEDRLGLVNATLSSDYAGGIPVVFATYALGEGLANTAGLEIAMFADVSRIPVVTSNVIADARRGDPNNVVVVGAHLDSVPEGPGIQDNGSGSAAILEIALKLARRFEVNGRDFTRRWIRNQVRFAWWGAEEAGLVGSDFYVEESLTEEELANIALYLNFDMIGSPNFVRFIYDGDGSAFELEGPPGSDEIEAVYEDYFTDRGRAFEATEISFRSDYSAFFDADIPFGGLFTGAEGIKTPEQAQIFGGTAGEQYDPCYHLACDTIDNISLRGLRDMSKAAAYSVAEFVSRDLSDFGSVPPAPTALRASSAPERRGDLYVR